VLDVDVLAHALLDPIGLPRDGVTILGGEPMAQPGGVAALLRRLKSLGVHTVVYTGYTLAALASGADPDVRAALLNTDLLIDGPYVAALSSGAGEWLGSTNQRVIAKPASLLG
jgi:anaerobic ribonucleoside-triphosphate reductase activating protein